MNTKTIIENTPGGKVLTGLGISAGFAAGAIVVAALFFMYGRYLDSRLTKLQILQLKKELGITDKTLVEEFNEKMPIHIV